MSCDPSGPFEKIATGVPGLDEMCRGGLPRGGATLLTGGPGSGKTTLAAHVLAAGVIDRGERVVFVATEQRADEVRRHLSGFEWDLSTWEAEGSWTFVDVPPATSAGAASASPADLEALLARISTAVRETGAAKVAVDGIDVLFEGPADAATRRRELRRLVNAATTDAPTALLTHGRSADDDGPAEWPAFVADNVIALRRRSTRASRQRTLEVVKLRGADHVAGERAFTIAPPRGIEILSRPALESSSGSSEIRITSGNVHLDKMCGGGFFRDSLVFVSGATGTGKTLVATEFLAGGARLGERCLLLSFEESRERVVRNAAGWSVDFENLEADGRLRIRSLHPLARSTADHLLELEREIDEFRPNRIAIDGLSALARVVSQEDLDEFALRLTSVVRDREIAALVTATTPSLSGRASPYDGHVASIADVVILLSYVEVFGEVRRGLTVLKQRGSMHDKDICEIGIDGSGMNVGRPFRHMMGILSGRPSHVSPTELERAQRLSLDRDDGF